MPDIFFHIGLSRAASTVLQKDVFRQAGAFGNNSRVHSLQSLKEFFHHKPPDIWKTKEGREVVELILMNKKDECIIYSHEGLSNNSIFSNMSHDYLLEYPYLLAKHLDYFKRYAWGERGRVGVFFLCRNQPDWLASRYTKTMNDKFRFRNYRTHVEFDYQNDFESRIRELLDDSDNPLARGLKFDLLTQIFREAVGDENVLPLLYEDFPDRELFQKLVDFTGLKNLDVSVFEKRNMNRHTRTSISRNRWMVRANHFRIRSRYSWVNLIFNGIGKRIERYIKLPLKDREIVLSENLRNEIQDYFKQSNKRFEGITGLNLGGLGYFNENHLLNRHG